jgi:hypothetical protein
MTVFPTVREYLKLTSGHPQNTLSRDDSAKSSERA